MCEDNIEIGVTEITNNIFVSATPTDQKIDINVTETTEEVALNVTPSVVEVNIDVTQELITEIVTVDASTCVNIIDVSVTDAADNVTLNITPSIVEVNINRGEGGGASIWGGITGTLSDQTDLQNALNAKQNLLGYTPVPTTRTITINGTTYDLSANRSWTVAGGLSGSGTTNYLSKWTGSTALGNSLVYDDGTNVMIGTTASLYKLTVNTASGVNFGVGRTSLFGTNDALFLNAVDDSYSSIPLTINGSHIGLYIGYSEKVRINASGNVLIGTTSGVTGGGLLQVNGIINSGEYGLLGGYVGLDTTPTTTPTTAGTLSWNDTDGTADLRLKGGNVTLQIGQENVVRVVNKTGATLNEADFRAVRIRSVSEGGAQGQRLAVLLAQGNSDHDSATTIGLVTESIANNQEGFITTSGEVKEIDTTGAKSYGGLETWADGDMLYLSPTNAGYLTKVKPVAPQHLVIIGYVVYAHAVHGKIFVKVDNGYEIDELHNVLITSPTNGQALVYDSSNSTWKNQSISSGGVSGSGTTNYVPKWTSSSAIGNSNIQDSGSLITLNGNTTISSGGLGIGTTALAGNTLRVSKNITGAVNSIGIYQDGSIRSDVTNNANYFATYTSIQNTAFTLSNLTHYRAGSPSTFTGATVVNQNGFFVESGLTGASNNYGFRGLIPSGTGRWNLFMDGTAQNYLSGSLGIGVTTPAYKLDISGDVNITGTYRVNGVAIGGGSISGSGTTNYHAKWSSSSSLSASLIYDNATSIAFYNTANGSGYALEFNNNAGQPRMDIVENGVYTAVVKSYNSAAWFSNNSNNPLILGTSGTERIRITGAGLVGIGTSSPALMLHVNGDIRTKMVHFNANGDNRGHRIYSRTMDVNAYTTATSMRFTVAAGYSVQFQYEIVFHATRTTSGNLAEIWYLRYTAGIAYDTSGNPNERWWSYREQDGNGIAGIGRNNQNGYFEVQNSAYDSGCRLTCVVKVTCNNWDVVTVTYP